MGRPRKTVKKKKVAKETIVTNLDFVELVDIVRKSRSKVKINLAFEEIEKRMKPRLNQIVFKFNIPGMDKSDIYQEALQALRYKAIKDYDKERGNDSGPYPFDKFATLCIRRHLATKLKASYQNKKKILNQSLSLDQERHDEHSEESLFLSDILPLTDGNVLEHIKDREYHRTLFLKLYEKLSVFEKQVFLYYVQKYSYDQIAEKINRKKRGLGEVLINVKSVDNALSRIKVKAKEIFDIFG